MHGVANGLDAWRTLMGDKLQLADDKCEIPISEFMSLKAKVGATGLRSTMVEIERIIDG